MIINAVCERGEQAEALSSVQGLGRIYSPDNIMPYVFRNEDAKRCRHFLEEEYVLVRNADEIGFLRENDYAGEIVADHTLYTYNRFSEEMLAGLGVKYDTAPLELTYRELSERGMEKSELMIYGRVPMMVSAGCVFRNTNDDRCGREDSGEGQRSVILRDRMKADFPVTCDCTYCYNIIFNSVPNSLHNEMSKIKRLNARSLRLYFTTEKPEEAEEIAGFFLRLTEGGDNIRDIEAPPYNAYTRGHFINGVT